MDDVAKALEAVKAGKSVKNASILYKIPYATLHSRTMENKKIKLECEENLKKIKPQKIKLQSEVREADLKIKQYKAQEKLLHLQLKNEQFEENETSVENNIKSIQRKIVEKTIKKRDSTKEKENLMLQEKEIRKSLGTTKIPKQKQQSQ